MEILCFAHRNEAQAFFESSHFVAAPEFFTNQLFLSENAALLITGEGSHSAAVSLAAALTRLPKVSAVVNFGCAGSLAVDRCPVGSLQTVRCSYGHNGGDFEFQSFNWGHSNGVSPIKHGVSPNSPAVDCLTVAKRISKDQPAPPLAAQIAPLVDRELWGLASVAKAFQKSWRATKLVTDDANAVDCATILSHAERISAQLLEHYLSAKAEDRVATVHGMLPTAFHLTHSQQQRLTKLRGVVDDASYAQEVAKITATTLSPKDRTRQLITWLEEQANPADTQLKRRLAELWPHSLKGSLKIPREGSSLELTLNLRSLDDWATAQKKLDSAVIAPALKVLHGEI